QFVADGTVTGLRIDHPDGLLDPAAYFTRLQRATLEALGNTGAELPSGRFYVVAEKILSSNEVLPQNWPVAGTTGYGFLNSVNGLFVDRDNESLLKSAYSRM